MITQKMGLWRIQNHEVLARDLLRDFCVVHGILAEQEQRFAHSQTISYAVLRELLGEAVSKGVFWRLKDTAHHLFRKSAQGKRSFEGYGMSEDYVCHQEQDSSTHVLESMVDWCVGYAFHECCKLREDAFQLQHYSNRLLQLKGRAEEHTPIIESLMPFTSQTKQSIARELKRISGVLEQARQLFLVYYAAHKDNAAVARFLCSEQALVQQCFGVDYEAFVQGLYGNEPWNMYVLAAQACLAGGHKNEAQGFIEQAQALGAPEQAMQELAHGTETGLPQSLSLV